MPSHKSSIALQTFVLILAIGWGVIADYSIAFPGPSSGWISVSNNTPYA
jgi:hypothetical protein